MIKDHKLLFFLLVLGISSATELFAIVTTVSPNTAPSAVYLIFFLSLFGTLSLMLTFGWHFIRYLAHHHKGESPSLWPSWRQASLLATVVVVSLFLKSLGILSLWDIVPIAIAAILIEFFFQADKLPSNEPA